MLSVCCWGTNNCSHAPICMDVMCFHCSVPGMDVFAPACSITDSADTLMRSVSSEIVRRRHMTGKAGCPADAGDVLQWLESLTLRKLVPASIINFKRATVMLQLPGDAPHKVDRTVYPAPPVRTGTYTCFTRDTDHQGLCFGPYGIPKTGQAIAGHLHMHDMVILKFAGDRLVLIDNGIGQFDGSVFSSSVWVWVNVIDLP